jgi:cytochrome c oxidase subunit II
MNYYKVLSYPTGVSFKLIHFNMEKLLDFLETGSFQKPSSPVMEGIVSLYNDIMAILTPLFVFVLVLVCATTYYFHHSQHKTSFYLNLKTMHLLENIYVIIPTIILLSILLPTLGFLYGVQNLQDANTAVQLEVIGNQWFWSYRYLNLYTLSNSLIDLFDLYQKKIIIEFDSYMIKESALVPGEFRLLEVDHRVLLPVLTYVRFYITALDVIHSWAIPALGIKMDAVPGRVNEVVTYITQPGVYYGQCSEICGVNHGFMPIAIEALNPYEFWTWVLKMQSFSIHSVFIKLLEVSNLSVSEASSDIVEVSN